MTSQHPEVVGLGYCVYDILAIVPGLPDFDSLEMAHLADLVCDGGGQVGTALAALARLGLRAGCVGLLGDDAEGRWLREEFVKCGIDVARLRLRADVGTNPRPSHWTRPTGIISRLRACFIWMASSCLPRRRPRAGRGRRT
jgi:hypothetical protein